MLKLAAVVPVYAGAPYLERLLVELDQLRRDFVAQECPIVLDECVLVLDSPVDDSVDVCEELLGKYCWVKTITLARNSGQHAATAAGIAHTSADWVATLDEDLLHDPKYLVRMFAHALSTGSDVVYAVNASSHGLRRDWSSRTAKRVVSALTALPEVRLFSSFRLIRGDVARAAADVIGPDTYLDVVLVWHTSQISSIEVVGVDEREKSTYSSRDLVAHFRRLLLSSNARLLRGGAFAGILGVCIALAGFAWLLMGTIFEFRTAQRGWLSLMATSLLFGGLITASLSFVSEHVLAASQRIQGRPMSFVIDRSRDRLALDWARERKQTL